MTTRPAEWHPGQVLARCLGYGGLTGAAMAVLILLVIAIASITMTSASGAEGFVGFLVLVGLYALPIGAVIGVACGLTAGLVLLLLGVICAARVPVRGRADSRRLIQVPKVGISLAAGAGAALLPLACLARWSASAPLVCLSILAFASGMLLGPSAAFGCRAGRHPRRGKSERRRI